MWNTSEGVRKLLGKERRLFTSVTGSLFDWLGDLKEIDEDWQGGASAFDNIPIENRRWLLLWVAEALLGDGPAPSLAAWNEGAVLAVFRHLEEQLDVEFDLQDSSEPPDEPVYWRSMVYEAWVERFDEAEMVVFGKGEGPNQPVHSLDSDQWSSKIEFLADQILFDRDCEAEYVMDAPPQVAEMSKRELGIDEEYYVGIPPLLKETDQERLEAFFRALDDDIGGK